MGPQSRSAWWTPGRHPSWPVSLYFCFVAGLGMTLLGFALSAAIAASHGLWSFQTQPGGESGLTCAPQLAWRSTNEARILKQMEDSAYRLQDLRKALLDESSPHFAMARQASMEEERFQSNLKNQALSFQVQSLSEAAPGILVSILLTAGFCLPLCT
jgi:hypothetical protein